MWVLHTTLFKSLFSLITHYFSENSELHNESNQDVCRKFPFQLLGGEMKIKIVTGKVFSIDQPRTIYLQC